MLKKRIIPCLDIKDGRTVKGVSFMALKDAGDPLELAERYEASGADELVFLDISATEERRRTLVPLVRAVSERLSIPFTVGGGVNSVAAAAALLEAGADKISVNTAAVLRPELIGELSQRFGAQCVVLAIDTALVNGRREVFTHGGKQATGILLKEWAKKAEALGAGEILLTSMMHDGSRSGFALELINAVTNVVSIPVIASGGAGSKEDFRELFRQTTAGAALAASLFHFGELSIPELKSFLKQCEIPIR
ncbi:imidazole glycerol phosphate synthase subunit HisF [Rurimicrobium arvi]|uniref:Imidazole glycerol phosphate synthase subunit HisF n=1 Tax=Rurimicrobium arvi TaxID=2049916 RepID=A0ABP8N0S9_9BACT